MQISNKLLIATLLASASTTAFAFGEGTSGLTGKYVGDYQFDVINSSQQIKAKSLNRYSWEWDFDSKTLSIKNGEIYKNPFRALRFSYQTSNIIPFSDNGDGTYTAKYDFKVFYPFFYNPNAHASSTFKITDTGASISISSVDIEDDGSTDGIPGTRMKGEFPHTIQLNWSGSASKYNPQWENLSPADLLK